MFGNVTMERAVPIIFRSSARDSLTSAGCGCSTFAKWSIDSPFPECPAYTGRQPH